ncbi:alkylglycerol monooxygenase isoform X2 [Gouania willdenowi]|uniref:alkylglycerol monooxygenase isoform X2 n=1 Tax=Gouania willdenowi TaxID=441366 RepID=UPI001055E5C2|nr:alkylglycerol monooxygenase isoform X2 [Gouania willdenowi]
MAADVAAASRGFRSVFSLLTPNESSFQTVDEVPKYVQQATPYFVGLMLLELLVGVLRTGGSVVTLSDGVTSISAGMISRLPLLLFRGCELTAYVYVWDHFHLMDLPWDSAWTWWITLLGVDLGYYWVHRCSHEVALLWAAHQVHHSSEYYNLTTALRQSVAQQFSSWIFYLPLALAVPPSVFAVHIQLNLLYQFWIHTELISDLGPLEWIFNTPKHHRVHHGRNIYCLDKNYGGILIIWDRLFGTFAPESDKVIYGLVFPIRTFETLHVQFHYYSHLWKRSRRYRNVSDKILTFINGPSWKPGKRRLGDYQDNPKVLPQGTVVALTAHVLLTLTALGYVIDQRPWAPFLETIRCVVLMILLRLGHVTPVLPSLAAPTQAFVSLSLIYWILQGFSQRLRINNKSD